MPDLGKYAIEVSAAYAAGLGLLFALVLILVIRARKVHNALRAAEERLNQSDDA